MEQNNNKKVWLWIIVAILVIGGIYLLTGNKSDGPADNGAVVSGDNSLTVSDQEAGTLSVLIDYVKLSKDGFVVIHEDASGFPGAIIGTSGLLRAGESRNVSILAELTPGKTYFAMLHADDGNGIFNPEIDAAFKTEDGKEISARFSVKGDVAGDFKG